MAILKTIFAKHEKVSKVIVYGSRAKGTNTDRSDVDLVICNSNIDRHQLGRLILDISNSNFPYTIDIQIYEHLKNKKLIEHINRVGKTFYNKQQ